MQRAHFSLASSGFLGPFDVSRAPLDICQGGVCGVEVLFLFPPLKSLEILFRVLLPPRIHGGKFCVGLYFSGKQICCEERELSPSVAGAKGKAPPPLLELPLEGFHPLRGLCSVSSGVSDDAACVRQKDTFRERTCPSTLRPMAGLKRSPQGATWKLPQSLKKALACPSC